MFKELLSRLGSTLDEHAIPYMIIGGQAVLLYGEPRLTRDIDITLGIDLGGVDTLLTVVRELSLKPIPEDVRAFVSKTMVLPVLEEDTGIRVDFILSFTPYESEAIKRARILKFKEQEVRFASPEDVIIHKIFAGRPRDLEDVGGIILKNSDIDRAYIRRWLEQFDLSSEDAGEKKYTRIFEEILEQ